MKSKLFQEKIKFAENQGNFTDEKNDICATGLCSYSMEANENYKNAYLECLKFLKNLKNQKKIGKKDKVIKVASEFLE